MKKTLFVLIITSTIFACGKKGKADEVCECIEKNVSVKKDPYEASDELKKCTKDMSKTVEGYTADEKKALNTKINDCLADSEKKNGVKMSFETR